MPSPGDNIILRCATPADVAALTAIENESFPDPSWTAEHFLEHACTVAEVAGSVRGFLVSRLVFRGSAEAPPEREILNLAVTSCVRRSGVATLLLENELARGAHLFLEVRESNTAARNLYQKLGFKEIGRRNAYYQNPEESGIVMRMKW